MLILLIFLKVATLGLGTDFPVEEINPFLTLRAAVLRMDKHDYPNNGFLTNEALDLSTALKGMTIWPQFASFSEAERGMLIQGMEATFFICAKPISSKEIPVDNYAKATFVRGKKVFDAVSF